MQGLRAGAIEQGTGRLPNMTRPLAIHAVRRHRLWGNSPSAEFAAPDHLLDSADEKNPGSRARQRNGCQDDEGPIKFSRAVQDKSGDGRSHNTCEITNEVLETCPASRGLGSRERLRDGPLVGSRSEERRV